MKKVKNIVELQTEMESNDELVEQFKNDPINTLKKVTSPIDNIKVFRLVIYFVGLALLFCLIIASVISLMPPVALKDVSGKEYVVNREVGQFFIMIGSAAIGALAGLLVPNTD